VGMGGQHALDLFHLAGREVLFGVEAPAPLQEALPAQHLVQPGDAAGVGGGCSSSEPDELV